MSIEKLLKALVVVSLTVVCVPSFASAGSSKFAGVTVHDSLNWREIGPASFGGRIADVEAVAGQPEHIFVASASGGIFRSRNNGITWEAVFDDVDGMLSIGDIAIAPSDPNIVWAGTGEPNNRQSSSWGGGIYRSLDGGDSWQHMGLAGTHHIGRVVIDPVDPNRVLVAAVGRLWGSNDERGVYRTTNGGASWERVLFVDSDTGAIDVAMHPKGRVLFAATYQRRRRGWGFVGGGPGSGLHRSTDGGTTWTRLSNGLPEGDIGRIGIAIAPSRPSRVYAVIEHEEGGVFRSDDLGVTWKRTSETNPRPMYYSQLRVDPRNENKVWMLGSPLFVSIDAGESFSSEGTAKDIHVDHHALWINPANGDHAILGNDGGLYMTYDSGENWRFLDNLPIAQYYAIAIDNRQPYWIYGGTQDNGTWALPSQNYSLLGIQNEHVVNIAYGDGFWVAIDPRDANLVYAESQSGRLYRVDMRTVEEKGIRPVPSDPEEKYRFNWSSPLLLSSYDPDLLYYGGNKLFRSNNQGQAWEAISPDLTLNQDWKNLPVMGLERDEETLSRDDGTSDFGTLTTVSESPLDRAMILTGSDDGQVHSTRDSGREWRNVTDQFGLPGRRWVSRVLASQHDRDTAYVAFDGHEDNDFSPYVFRSRDGGVSWSSIVGDLPDGVVVNNLAEYPNAPDLLLAGTESGLWVTLDGGTHWNRMRNGLPAVPIDDIVVHPTEGDIILGTHGRGIWVLDDARWLLGVSSASASHQLLDSRKAVQFYQTRALPAPGAARFSGPNPPYGAYLTYSLASDVEPTPKATPRSTADQNGPEQAVELHVYTAEGVHVQTMSGPASAGFHRVAWDLRHPLSFEPESEDEGWFGPAVGPFALPGTYRVELTAGAWKGENSVAIGPDPNAGTSPAALQQRHTATMRVNELLGAFVAGAKRVSEIEAELKTANTQLTGNSRAAKVTDQLKQMSERLEELGKKFSGGWQSQKFELLDLLGQLQASSSMPTEAQSTSLGQLDERLRDNLAALNKESTELGRLLKTVAGFGSAKLDPIPIP